MAAGTVTFSCVHTRLRSLNVWVVTVTWTGSTVDGTVPSTDFPATITGGVGGSIGEGIGGSYLFKVRTIPGSGVHAPTGNYTVTLTDVDSVDILGAACSANRSASAAQDTLPLQESTGAYAGPVYVEPGSLTFNLSGNSVTTGASGSVKLYFTSQN